MIGISLSTHNGSHMMNSWWYRCFVKSCSGFGEPPRRDETLTGLTSAIVNQILKGSFNVISNLSSPILSNTIVRLMLGVGQSFVKHNNEYAQLHAYFCLSFIHLSPGQQETLSCFRCFLLFPFCENPKCSFVEPSVSLLSATTDDVVINEWPEGAVCLSWCKATTL